MFRIRGEISREVAQRSILGVKNPEWHGMWKDIGQILKKFPSPVVWKFPPEQIQNPEKVAEYLKENYSGSFKEGKLIALCWALDNAYSMLLITAQQHLQLEGKGNKSADTPVTQATVKPEGQPKPVVATPVQRRKYKTKCICLVDDDGEAEPSQPAEESELEVIIKSLSLESLCSLQNNLT